MTEEYFIFDVDGTLTPSRGKINYEHKLLLLEFNSKHISFAITGSDRPKTLEQLGGEVYASFEQVYQCAGNDIYKNDKNIYRSQWKLKPVEIMWLEEARNNSIYPGQRFENHIEQRCGMANFSVVGRDADPFQRQVYYDWDSNFHERTRLCKEFNVDFQHLTATVAGMIGIDIYEKHKGKEQIIRDFLHRNKIYYFGDKMMENGNDYEIALALLNRGNCAVFAVQSPDHTFELIRQLDK